MLLFLDFDGVLHPSVVFLRNGRPQLADGTEGELFMWAPQLEAALGGLPVRIVLSTNWVRHRGFSRVRNALSERLRRRVIGSTFHSEAVDWYDNATRYQQISRYLARSPGRKWVAIDDLHEGEELGDWPLAERHHLILTDPDKGLSAPGVVAALRLALENSRSGDEGEA